MIEFSDRLSQTIGI